MGPHRTQADEGGATDGADVWVVAGAVAHVDAGRVGAANGGVLLAAAQLGKAVVVVVVAVGGRSPGDLLGDGHRDDEGEGEDDDDDHEGRLLLRPDEATDLERKYN